MENKTKNIPKIIYEDFWSPQVDPPVEWETFKRLAEERIKYSISLGYSNPKVRLKGEYDYQEMEIVLTKEESDEAYEKRKKIILNKENAQWIKRLDKLKREAKELGLKVE